MTRLIGYILFSLALVLAITWLLALPGVVQIDAAGYHVEPQIGVAIIFVAAVILASIFIFSLIRKLLAAPRYLRAKSASARQKQGIEALSNSFIALQAGDAQKARHLAREARGKLPQNSAAQLLEARSDLALGKWGEAREQYRTLIDNPKTSLAALSGLYEQAQAQGRKDAALTFAHKAHSLSPELPWASEALFNELTQNSDWAGALKMVHAQNAKTRAEKQGRRRKLAVLHTAIAAANEISDPNDALDNARVALKLEPDFVPAALIAARIHSNKGEIRKSSSLLKRTWRATGHPHVAALYASAQPGISPVERLKRLGDIIPTPPETEQGAIVLARAAIAARDWAIARRALNPFIEENPSQGVCVAMAQIEEGEKADEGRARQWLARAVSAPRDPVWVADGVTAAEWAPLSPITGQFDAFEFKVPTSALSLEQNQLADIDTGPQTDMEAEITPTPPPADEARTDKSKQTQIEPAGIS